MINLLRAPETLKFAKINMEIADQYLFKLKMDYIKLVLLIIRIRYEGGDPSEKLLNQARELGTLTGVSAEEFNNL